jgi:tRNA threonylcarbamoyladenosine biosynthesis protein TsaE
MTECCATEEDTEACGERAGRAVLDKLKAGRRGPFVYALYGGLGAGKTCWTRGFARGLGIGEPVTSPTYTIINEYTLDVTTSPGLTFVHIDAYRLLGPEDFEAAGGEEALSLAAAAVVEWPERIESSLPEDTERLSLEILTDGTRKITHHEHTGN